MPSCQDAAARLGTGLACLWAFASALGMPGAFGGPPAPFTEEAQLRGIDYISTQVQNHGQGVTFVDLDGDGDADVIAIGRGDGVVGVYENDGKGQFTDHSGTSGIGPVLNTSGVAAGDYDRDGDLDLYISRWAQPNLLLRNDGGFQFVNVASQAGVSNEGKGTGCAWADYDMDGHIDLYVANWDSPNLLYHNLGNGTFEDVAVMLGVDRGNDPTFQATFFDLGEDGDPDLYLATDRGTLCETTEYRNHLFENVGGTFKEITDESGTEACVDAMCIAVGDFDGNGHQDLYSTNTPPGNALLLNQGDGTFVERAVTAGVAVFATGWGSVFLDYDNDGMLDLYVCNASVPNRLFRGATNWPCTDVAEPMQVDTGGLSYTVSVADIDIDGDLDLLVQNRGERIRLFINHDGESRRWARFDVVGRGESTFAIGATVEIRTGETWQLREVIAGSNYKNQNELVIHFGLGDAEMMDEIRIRWNGGATRTLSNLAGNATWTLYPQEKLGDGDQDGDIDLDDFAYFGDCRTGHAPGEIQPGCEMMDYQGDGDVDLLDWAGFQIALSR